MGSTPKETQGSAIQVRLRGGRCRFTARSRTDSQNKTSAHLKRSPRRLCPRTGLFGGSRCTVRSARLSALSCLGSDCVTLPNGAPRRGALESRDSSPCNAPLPPWRCPHPESAPAPSPAPGQRLGSPWPTVTSQEIALLNLQAAWKDPSSPTVEINRLTPQVGVSSL